ATNPFFPNSTQVTLPATGDYVLLLQGTSSSSNYTLHLRTPTVPAPTAYTLGSLAQGTVAAGGQPVEYTVDGKAGQAVYFNGLSPSSSVYVQLLSPADGNSILTQYSSSSAGP